jgi:hypothetical protein
VSFRYREATPTTVSMNMKNDAPTIRKMTIGLSNWIMPCPPTIVGDMVGDMVGGKDKDGNMYWYTRVDGDAVDGLAEDGANVEGGTEEGG